MSKNVRMPDNTLSLKDLKGAKDQNFKHRERYDEDVAQGSSYKTIKSLKLNHA